MSCFIHRNQEGVAVCKKCGKNMCVECSSMVEHSGLCPTCYRPELIEQIEELEEERKHLMGRMIVLVILAIISIYTIVGPLICLVLFSKAQKRRKEEIPLMIKDLKRKVRIIDKAVASGSAKI